MQAHVIHCFSGMQFAWPCSRAVHGQSIDRGSAQHAVQHSSVLANAPAHACGCTALGTPTRRLTAVAPPHICHTHMLAALPAHPCSQCAFVQSQCGCNLVPACRELQHAPPGLLELYYDWEVFEAANPCYHPLKLTHLTALTKLTTGACVCRRTHSCLLCLPFGACWQCARCCGQCYMRACQRLHVQA